MTIINGKVYYGNVTIVNGQVISGETSNDTSSKKFDKTKKESANGINRISINSALVAVKVSACSANEITAHLHGSAIMDSDITLSLTKVNDEVKISVIPNGASNCNTMSVIMGNSVVLNNINSCGSNDLTIDVIIPSKVFEKLYIQSENSNIDVSASVNAKNIELYNKNGNIDVDASFQSLNIDCKNGNINVDSEATCDVRLDIYSKNGNADVFISNIGVSTVSVDSKNGNSKNTPRLKGSFTAIGYVTSKNGNANFH